MFCFWEQGVYKKWAWIASATVIMMSVLNQSGEDQVECPLCMEPFEVDDLNFFPCTCGYQVSIHLCWYDYFRTHVIMQLWFHIYYEVLIHFLIWLFLRSTNRRGLCHTKVQWKYILSYFREKMKSKLQIWESLLQFGSECSVFMSAV